MESPDQSTDPTPAENIDIPLEQEAPFIEEVSIPTVPETPEPTPANPAWLQRVNATLPAKPQAPKFTSVAPSAATDEDPAWLKRLNKKYTPTAETPNWQKQIAEPPAHGFSTNGVQKIPKLIGIGILLWILVIAGDFYFGYFEGVQQFDSLVRYGLLNLLIPTIFVSYIMQRKNWARFAFALVALWAYQPNADVILNLLLTGQLRLDEAWAAVRIGLMLVVVILLLMPGTTQWFQQKAITAIETEETLDYTQNID